MIISLQVRILVLSREVGYLFLSLDELGEKLRATIVLGNFVKAITNSYRLIVFGKCLSLVKIARSRDIFFS